MEKHRLLRRLPIFALLYGLLLLPALINGGGFLFPDTTAYIRGADAAVFKITDHSTNWSDHFIARFPGVTHDNHPKEPASAQPPGTDHIALSGRSIYYGILLYLSFLSNTMWPAILIQAGITLAAVILTITKYSINRDIRFTQQAGLGIVFILTGIGYFVAFGMPDFLAPLAVLAIANLALPPRGTTPRTVFWALLLIFALAAHSANLLIACGLTAILIVIRVFRSSNTDEIRVRWPIVAIILAIFCEILFSAGVRYATNSSPVRPPFITARLLEEGPGARFLQARCGSTAAFEICRYKDRPIVPADTFLWSDDPRKGVFSVASPNIQRALGSEQARFGMAVFRFDPLGVMAMTVRDTVRQFHLVKLTDFSPDSDTVNYLKRSMPKSAFESFARTRANSGKMPLEPAQALAFPLELGCLALLISFAAVKVRSRTPEDRNTALLALLIISGILINAVICGALSGPHDRYQARMVYILPVAVLAIFDRIYPWVRSLVAADSARQKLGAESAR